MYAVSACSVSRVYTAGATPRWLAASPAKRYTELLLLTYSPFWMIWALGIVVPFKLYEARNTNNKTCAGSPVALCVCSHKHVLVLYGQLVSCAGELIPVPCWLQHAGKAGYLAIGLGAAIPCIILPWMLEHKADRSKPWFQKYWVKANIWIAIFSFIGNYFWTHYFYTVLGAEYTFPSWRLNEVGEL